MKKWSPCTSCGRPCRSQVRQCRDCAHGTKQPAVELLPHDLLHPGVDGNWVNRRGVQRWEVA